MADSKNQKAVPSKDGHIVGRELTPSDLGLKPFHEFEKYLSVLLKRVPDPDRKALLEKMYAVAGERIITKSVRGGLEYTAAEAREKRALIQQVRTHVKGIRKVLAALDLNDDDEINTKLDEFNRSLSDLEKILVALIHPELQTSTEKAVPLPEIFVLGDAGYRHGIPAGLKPRANDEWLAKALYEFFPKPGPGKRSRFARNKVIQKVLAFVGLPTTERRVVNLLKSHRSPKN